MWSPHSSQISSVETCLPALCELWISARRPAHELMGTLAWSRQAKEGPKPWTTERIRQRPKGKIPGEQGKSRISLLRWTYAIFGYIVYFTSLDYVAYGSHRTATEDCGQGRGGCGGYVYHHPGGPQRADRAKGATTKAQRYSQGANPHPQEREDHPGQGDADAGLPTRYKTPRRFGKDSASYRNRGTAERSRRVERDAGKPQGWQNSDKLQRGGDGGSRGALGSIRRRKRRTQSSTRQSHQREGADATTTHSDADPDDRVHDDIWTTKGQFTGDWNTAYVQHDTGAASEATCVFTSGWCKFGNRNCQEKRCTSTLWSGETRRIESQNGAIRQECRKDYSSESGKPRSMSPLGYKNRGGQRRLTPWEKGDYVSWSGWFGLVMSPICLTAISMRGGGLHPGHRLLPGWRLWILTMLLTGSVNASEDHDLLQRFRQARAAEALQHSIQTELGNRWRDFSFLYGLRRPPIDQVHQAAIHRPESSTPHVPEVVGTTLRHAVEPEYIRQDVSNKWQDLRRADGTIAPWKAYPFHEAVYTSAFFAHEFKHYILTTLTETTAHRQEVPMAVEISWFLHDCAHAGLSKRWMKSVTTTVSFLQTVGMLQSCNMAYRCDILVNGQIVTTTWLTFSPGDFAEIQARQQPPPDDTESETELPHPIVRVSSVATSSTISSDSETQTPGEYFGDVAISNAIVIYRPPNRHNRPHQIVTPVTQEDNTNLGVVTEHWTDLRYHRWTLAPVHGSYEDEYPPGDYVHTFLLVALCDLPSPLHQVILLVVHTPENMLIKAQVTIPVFERMTALMLTRLEHFCDNGITNCRVYLNGHLLPEGTQRRVTNGDYVRITMNVAPGPRTSALMATEFHVMPNAPGLEYADETAIQILTGHNSQMVTRTSGQIGSRHDADTDQLRMRNNEWYWIFLGFYVYVALIGCLRLYDPPNKRPKTKTQRRRRTIIKKPVKTLFYAYLLLGQHCHGRNLWRMTPVQETYSSVMRQFATPALPTSSQYTEQGQGTIRVGPVYEITDQLRPPGNPKPPKLIGIESIISPGNLTDYGCALLDFVTIYINIQRIQKGMGHNSPRAISMIETETAVPPVKRHIQLSDALPPRVQLCLSEVLDVTDADGLHAADIFAGTAATSAAGHVPYTENVEREVPKEHTPLPRSSQDVRVHSADVVHMPDRDPSHKSTPNAL